MDHLKQIPIEWVYGFIAICGGVARYLNGFANGTTFNWKILLASTFVSGFSGYMFAQLGVSLQFPFAMLSIMAGTGGFFGDQTMKFIMEYFSRKVD